MESLSRLSQRIQENIQESTRDLSFVPGSSSSALFDTSDERIKEIRKLLDSSHDKEKIEGMKSLLALISKNRDVSSFFAHVIKIAPSQTLELKKLVYIYILRYSSQEPDLSLLSINTFQKDLNDSSPLIRCMSIRVLSGMRVPGIGTLVLEALKKGSRDSNPWVRKAAALGIPKVYSTDPTLFSSLLQILTQLLDSNSPIPLGATIQSFNALCPDRLDIIHPYYRKLCKAVVDLDQWAQVSVIELLVRYAMVMLEKPGDLRKDEKESKEANPTLTLISNSPSSSSGPDSPPDFLSSHYSSIDEDLLLLLHCTLPLLSSYSPAVVLSTVRLHFSLSPPTSNLRYLSTSLLRLLPPSPPATELVLLTTIKSICQSKTAEHREIFKGKWRNFLVNVSSGADGLEIVKEKIEILKLLVDHENVESMIDEFVHYSRSSEPETSSLSILALGYCVESQPQTSEIILKHLLKMLRSRNESTTTSAVLVIKSIVLSSSAPNPQDLVSRLAARLNVIPSPEARTCIYWLVGEHPGNWGEEVLRIGAKKFREEAPAVKVNILTLAAKLLARRTSPNPTLHLLTKYLFQLAKYDTDYDVRSQGRFFYGLTRGLAGMEEDNGNEDGFDQDQVRVVLRREQVEVILGGGRSNGSSVESSSHQMYELGTMSLIAGKTLPGSRSLPGWLEEGTDSSLRDVEEEEEMPTAPLQPLSALKGFGSDSRFMPASSGFGVDARSATSSPVSVSVAPRNKERDLEKFYASESESESEEEEETESEDDDEEEEEEEEEESDEEEG